MDCLNTIVGDLKKLEEDTPRVRILRGAQDALIIIRELWTQASHSASPLEERLQSLKKKIDAWS